jgi:hypothetical protein
MRFWLAPLGAVVLGLGASACGGKKLSETTLRFTERETANFLFVDNPPKSPSGLRNPRTTTGDQLAFVTDLLDESGGKVGQIDGTCVVTAGATSMSESRALCDGVAHVPGGQLVLAYSGELGVSAARGAVIGGTGRYEGASGSYRTTGTARSRDSFHIYLPKG